MKKTICIFVSLLITGVAFAQIPDEHLQLWLISDSVELNAGKVSVWYDQSGHDHHLNQANTDAQPTVEDSTILNNFPTVNFDGIDDFMEVDFGIEFEQPNTIFIVFNSENTPNTAAGVLDGITDHGIMFTLSSDNTLATISNNSTTSNQLKYDKTFPFDFILSTIIYNGSNSILLENGEVKISGTLDNYSISDLQIGRRTWLNTKYSNISIAEFLFYDTVLNETDRQQIEAYLMSKYAPPVDLGTNINIPYGFCDTSITTANKTWFTDHQWSSGETDSVITVNASGTYTVTVTSIFGVTSTDAVQVSYPAFVQKSDTVICAGDTLAWSPGLSPDAYDYLWSDGSTDSVLNIHEAGDYWVEISDTLGCSRRSDTIHISVDSFPLLSALETNQDVCDGASLGLSSPLPAEAYLWSTGSTDSTCLINGGGEYRVSLTNDRGCVLKDTSQLSIIGTAPDVDFSFDTVCLGNPTHFTDLSEPGDDILSWAWDFGDGNTDTASSPEYTFPLCDTFPVSLTINTLNCTNKITKEVFTKPLPHAMFSTWGEVDTYCINTPIQFINESDSSTGQTLSYQWDFGDSAESTLPHPTHQYSEAGAYNVILVVTQENSCADTFHNNILIENDFTAANDPDLINPSQSIIIPANSNVDFTWNVSEDALFYDFYISSDSLFNNVLAYQDSLFQNLVNTDITWGFDTLYWKVRAHNRCNEITESEIRHFMVFNPANAHLHLWLQADSVELQDTAAMTWYDLSGNNNHLYQSLEDFRPVFLDSIDKINFHPVISFDGVDDFMSGSFADTIPQPNTIFILFNFSAPIPAGIYDGLPGGRHTMEVHGDGDKLMFSASDENHWKYYNINVPLNYQLNATVYHGNNTISYENGFAKTLETGFSGDITDSLAGLEIGRRTRYNTKYAKINVPEIIVYDTVLSNNERQFVEKYLHDKYAPPVNLSYDIRVPYGFCDTTITTAEEAWFTDYAWSTGDTTPTITVSEGGEYEVTVTDIFGFTSTDDIRVYYPEVNVPAPVSEVCYGDTLTWDTQLEGSDYSFSWLNASSTGSSAQYWQNTQAAVEITDSLGCVYRSDTISVQLDMFSETAGFGQQDTALCIGNRLTFLNGADEAVSYQWQDGSTDDEFLIESAGTYHATVTNDLGCVAVDTVDVSILGTVPEPDFDITGHCAGAEISLEDQSASPDGTITAWGWSSGGTVFDNQQNSSISFDTAGNYDISLEIYTDVGCHNTLSQTVEVHPLPVPDFAPLTACEGNEVYFDNLSTLSQGEQAYTRWQFSAGGEYQTGSVNGISHVFDTAGSYQVSMEAVSEQNCADEITRTVDIRSAPEADFVTSAICEGQPAWFINQSSTIETNPIMSWSWDFGDGDVSTESSPQHQYETTGLQDVELRVTSLNGCTDTLRQSIEISPVPEAMVSGTTACAGQPLTLTDSSVISSGSITTRNWQVDSLSFNTEAPEVTFADTGSYNLQLSVESDAGCQDSWTGVLQVMPTPEADFELPSDWGAVPLSLTADNLSSGAESYLWHFGDGESSTQAEPTHTWQDSGRYEITMVAISAEGCTDTIRRTLRVIVPVIDLAVLDVRADMDGNYLLVEADIANAGSVPVDNPAMELSTSGDKRQREVLDHTLHAGVVETYLFNTRLWFADGELPDYICVWIDPVSPDDAPENNEKCQLQDAGFRLLDVYPNPVNDELSISLVMPENGDVRLQLFDNAGRLLFSKEHSLNKGHRVMTMDVSPYSQGSYSLRVTYGDESGVVNFMVR